MRDYLVVVSQCRPTSRIGDRMMSGICTVTGSLERKV